MPRYWCIGASRVESRCSTPQKVVSRRPWWTSGMGLIVSISATGMVILRSRPTYVGMQLYGVANTPGCCAGGVGETREFKKAPLVTGGKAVWLRMSQDRSCWSNSGGQLQNLAAASKLGRSGVTPTCCFGNPRDGVDQQHRWQHRGQGTPRVEPGSPARS